MISSKEVISNYVSFSGERNYCDITRSRAAIVSSISTNWKEDQQRTILRVIKYPASW